MKRWISLAAALYPRSWREQFGNEFEALLEDVKPTWPVFANVLGGAIKMQMKAGTNWVKLVTATAAVGALVSGAASFTIAPSYVSTAVLAITPQPDPVRPTSPEALRQRATAHLQQVQSRILSRWSLAKIISDPAIDLYPKERTRVPTEDVEDLMRRNIRIEAVPSRGGGLAPVGFSVSFSYPDQIRAQAAARALALRFTQEDAAANRERAIAYKNLWQDLAAAHLAKPAPPPPVEASISVLDQASAPKEGSGPSHLLFAASGLGAGMLLGLLAALAIRHPRRTWQLGAFALAGCLLAAAASLLIPVRYTSTAVMEIAPAVLTEDPSAPLPRATPIADFLGHFGPRVLSDESLSTIIQDPRLNLYPDARAAKPLEEVVRDMRERDIRIASLNPASGVFTISFSYPDEKKSAETANTLISRFIQESNSEQQASAAHMSVIEKEILSRRAGEYLEPVDMPTVSNSPGTPNRLMIAVVGFFAGLLVGTLALILRRPRSPSLQPA